MSDKKLTPRVGDRVIVRAKYIHPGRTFIGKMDRIVEGGWYLSVAVDGQDSNWRVSTDEVEVVDRQPVEWPEGWRALSWGGAGFRWSSGRMTDFNRNDLREILATGPDMLARWDELMGGDA